MISVILQILGIFAGAVLLTQVFTGCSISEAITKVQSVFKENEQTIIPLEQDEGLWSEIWDAIRKIIGDARSYKLRRTYEAIASSLGGIRLSGHHSGLPYMVIIVDLVDDTERKLIEAVVVGFVKKHLRMRGLPDMVIATWGKLSDYGLDCLEIRFSETDEERTIIRTALANELGQEAMTDDEDF